MSCTDADNYDTIPVCEVLDTVPTQDIVRYEQRCECGVNKITGTPKLILSLLFHSMQQNDDNNHTWLWEEVKLHVIINYSFSLLIYKIWTI